MSLLSKHVQILIVSHTPTATTGYGRVTRRLAHALRAAGHELAVLGAGYTGGPHELPCHILPWPNPSPEPIARAIDEFAPSVLFTIGDPWMFEFVPEMPQRKGLTWIAYFPIDGYPLPEAWVRWIRSIDVPVVFSRFTQDLVAKATGITPKLIYHGVDTASFRPTDKDRSKELAHVQGHFVVGTVARNQQRKNLPALLKAFARFAAGKPDVLLYLHTQIRGDHDMQALARHLGIADKTRVTADLGADRGVPDAMLATVYNAMDVFVLPTMAEGFGLPIMEAQACGTPVLATDFSACPELVPEEIQRLKVKDTLVMHRNFEQAIVDVDDVVAKLEHFYRHREELKALGQRCHEFAQQFEWSIACKQFVDLIASLPVKTPPLTAMQSDPVREDTSAAKVATDAEPTRPGTEVASEEGVLGPVLVTKAREPQPASTRVFGYFDHAYVLNLDSDTERLKRVSARLNSLGVRFERFSALTPSPTLRPRDARFKPGLYAAAQSHRAILQLVWERGHQRVLIFEDDVVLRDDVAHRMEQIVPQLEAIPWDMFYLGLHLASAGRRCGPNLLQVLRGYHCHAYAVARKAIPRLIAHIDRNLAEMAGTFDGFEDSSLLKVCADPILAIQEPNFSHTYGEPTDRLHQYFDLFDVEEFRRHCREMRSWNGALAAGDDLRRAGNCYRAGRLDEAEAICQKILDSKPTDPAAMHLLGIICGHQGESVRAVSLLEKAIALQPQNPDVLNDLAVALEAQGELALAAQRYRESLRLRPKACQVWTNLANALLHNGELDAAAETTTQALRIERRYAPAHNVTGCILLEQARPQEACRAFSEAIGHNRDFAEAHANLGQALLTLGQFEEGWREHEWRRANRFHARPGRAWDGSDLFGRTLLLYAEGGLGNTLQFIRYAPILAEMGAILTLECQRPLVELLRSVKGIRNTVRAGEKPPHYDAYCALMSLPAVLKTTLASIPAQVPYLQADPDLVQRWAPTLKQIEGFRVGICWEGEQALVYRRNRSIPLAQFAGLANIPGVRLISLQKRYPIKANFPIVELKGLDEEHGPFLDTAAVMQHLDLIITCDTSIAHLAGALGVPVWVALPYAADWRRMLDRQDSPWYPSMRLFRQSRFGDWEGLFQQIAQALSAEIARRNP